MASQIMLPKNIDLSKINFGAPKLLNGGARIVPVSYDNKQFVFQTARMVCNYGLSKWGEGAAAKYSLDGSFKNKEMNKSLQNFYDMLMKLDKFMIDRGVENSVEWFKKKHNNSEVVAAIYSHTVRFPKDKETGEVTDKYAPSFKMNVPIKDGRCTCQVYDNRQAIIDIMSGINLKGATISAIIKCTGVWLAGGNFGLTFRVEQLRVEATQDVLSGFAFQNDDDNVCAPEDEGDEDDNMSTGNPQASGSKIDTSDDEDAMPSSQTQQVDEDDEEDGIDPPVQQPTASKSKAAPAKRVTAKK